MTEAPRSRSVAKGERPHAPEPLRVPVADSHCHVDIGYNDEWLEVETAQAMAAAVGVDRIVQVGVDVTSSVWSVQAAHTYPRMLATVALHPNEAPRIVQHEGAEGLERALARIAELAQDERVRGIGETGLDFFRTTGEEDLRWQEESFRRHIRIAREVGKPVIVHDRDAHDDVVRVLLDEGATDVVFHCFSGDESLARIAAEHGWHCSFAGTVTFKNNAHLRRALALLPIDLVLVETDAPFLAPMPHRGKPNASYLIPLTMRAMAEARGADLDALCAAVSANTERVFGSFA